MESVKVSEKDRKLAKVTFTKSVEQYQDKLARQQVYRAVDILSKVVDNIAFASLPENEPTIFLGLSNVLRQPEFMAHPEVASRVVEVLEQDFVSLLDGLDIDDDVRIFVGEENLIEQFSSCSMLVTRYKFGDRAGYMGVLGPMRMRYSYNKAALEQAKSFLEESEL